LSAAKASKFKLTRIWISSGKRLILTKTSTDPRCLKNEQKCSAAHSFRKFSSDRIPFPNPERDSKFSGSEGNVSSNALWKIFLFTMLISLFGLIYFQEEKRKKRLIANRFRSVGTAKIGGNWSMVNHDGFTVSRASFHGKYILIYFGFTFCPDICPDELRKMKQVIDALDSKYGEVVQPLFVSLDPWRDSIDQIRNYVKQFSPRFLGVTGTPQQCEIMAHNFRVYTATDRSDRSSEDDYVVDHSIFMYLMDDGGNFVEFYSVDKEPEYIIENITQHLVARDVINPGFWWKVKHYFDDD